MEYTPERVVALLKSIDWEPNSTLRLFWVRDSTGNRTDFVKEMKLIVDEDEEKEGEAIISLIVRDNGFTNPNALLSDAQKLFDQNESELTQIHDPTVQRVTIVIIAKDDFRMIQCGSPIILPNWFPVMPGQETYFQIADLGRSAELELLACEEARIDHIAELLFELEQTIVNKLEELKNSKPDMFEKFFTTLGISESDQNSNLLIFSKHLQEIIDKRAYRPNAARESKFLAARFLKMVLNSAPKEIATNAKYFSECFTNHNQTQLKPTLFALMMRTAAKMDSHTANWHSIILAFYQGYQLMNGAAHCGEYPKYSVALQYANSVNLREFYVGASAYVETLT